MAALPRITYSVSGAQTPAPERPLAPDAPLQPETCPPGAVLPRAAALRGDTAIAPVVIYLPADPPSIQFTDASGAVLARSGSRRLGPARSGLATILAVSASTALLFALVHHHSKAATAVGRTPISTGHAASGARRRLGPINLPAPLGDAPRKVPLATVWIIASDLPSADLTAISREMPFAVRYLVRYSLPGDELWFKLRRSALRPVERDEAALAAAAARPRLLLTAAGSGAIRLPAPPARHDLAIVVITATPSIWSARLPADRTPPRPTTSSRPDQTRLYIVTLAPGTGSPANPLTPSAMQPQRAVSDPRSRGSIARALARIFVDATGADWPATG